MDSGLTRNYIDPQECVAWELKIEAKDQGEELQMAYGMGWKKAKIRYHYHLPHISSRT